MQVRWILATARQLSNCLGSPVTALVPVRPAVKICIAIRMRLIDHYFVKAVKIGATELCRQAAGSDPCTAIKINEHMAGYLVIDV